ncbi:hypothetical protein BH10PAT3_BH10PAT3_0780 [soil metagenome]
MPKLQDPTKIRNIAIIAHDERFAYETPVPGFSSRRVQNKSKLGLLFPAKGRL